MKVMIRQWIGVVLCAALLISALPFATFTASAQTQAESDAAVGKAPVMAIVPLDNRPVCVDRVIYAAESAGFVAKLPPENTYVTKLDNQDGTGVNGSQHGDGAAIMTWLEQMEESGCDYYVIHLDQLMSGGLVGSRDPDNTSGGASEEERALLTRLKAITDKKVNGVYENHIYIVETVMRLASTSGYKGRELAQYYAYRGYAEKERKAVTTTVSGVASWDGAVSAINSIRNGYSVAPDGSTITYGSALTSAMVENYHQARRRKLDILLWTRATLKNPNMVFIFGVDDASPKNTIQTNEINLIKNMMANFDYYLSADTDSCGLMAVGRCANDYYGLQPKMKTVYFGNKVDTPADSYDIGTLRENVKTHVESLNATYIDDKYNAGMAADVEVLVLTKSDTTIGDTGKTDATYTASINALVERANSNIRNNVPTIIIEASTESNYQQSWVKGFINLQDQLLEKVEISKLVGYSNWNTVGNSIGIALGTGAARYAYLEKSTVAMDSADVAFVKSITYSYVKDIAYNARNKHQNFTWTFQYWITNKAGGSGWNNGNFYQAMKAYNDGENYVNQMLEEKVMTLTDGNGKFYSGSGTQIVAAMMSGDIYTSLRGSAVETANVGNVTLSNFHCPWYRQFEMTFDIAVETPAKFSGGMLKGVSAKQIVASVAVIARELMGTDAVVIKKNGVEMTQGIVGTGCTIVIGGVERPIAVTGDVVVNSALSDDRGDGVVDTTDVRAVMMSILGQRTQAFSDVQVAAADADGNGKVASTDARRMLQMALK